jgi:beta-lactamase regulating signal transducer with metallopeptidase domain
MNLFHAFNLVLQTPVVEKLGLVLLHSLWQGIAVAILLKLVLLVLRQSSANARYLAACTGLLLAAILPVVTLLVLSDRSLTEPVSMSVSHTSIESDNRKTSSTRASDTVEGVSTMDHDTVDGEQIPVTLYANGMRFIAALAFAAPGRVSETPAASLANRYRRLLQPWLYRITYCWLVGVVVFSIRLLLTWKEVKRLQSVGVRPAGERHVVLLREISTRLGLSQIVRLLESSLVEVPTVIGWLKPVILLPIASISSLTTSQLEAILAHELAHIRRADYAVNVIQCVIETLLFYHPLVWWISSTIRQERENCCDDLAASISGDTAGYVAALLRMEELRSEPRALALGVNGGNLLSRVRRLVVPMSHDQVTPWWLTGVVSLSIIAGVIGLPAWSQTRAEPTTDGGAKVNDQADAAKAKAPQAAADITARASSNDVWNCFYAGEVRFGFEHIEKKVLPDGNLEYRIEFRRKTELLAYRQDETTTATYIVSPDLRPISLHVVGQRASGYLEITGKSDGAKFVLRRESNGVARTSEVNLSPGLIFLPMLPEALGKVRATPESNEVSIHFIDEESIAAETMTCRSIKTEEQGKEIWPPHQNLWVNSGSGSFPS